MNLIGLEPEADYAHVRAWDEAHGIKPDGYIVVTKTPYKKCARCWRHCADTDMHEWTEVCGRCNDALEGVFREKVQVAILSAHQDMGL